MFLILDSTVSMWGQLITVLLIFAFVLTITALTTRWIGNYQKIKRDGSNIEVIETRKVSQNGFVEIVRIGDKYFALGIGKDNISTISEISKDSLQISETATGSFSFKEFSRYSCQRNSTRCYVIRHNIF